MLIRIFAFFGIMVLHSGYRLHGVVHEKASSPKEISAAIERGLSFLKNIQKRDGAIRDTINPLFDVWETALAASAIFDLTQDTTLPMFKNAMVFLKKNENAAGLICHNQKCKNATCLETTAVYFSLLLKTGQKDLVKNRLDTLARLQQNTGEWLVGNPDVREALNFPSVTGFMLGTFYQAGAGPCHKEKALLWLASQQQPEGHWGRAWEYYGCDAYALWAILPVLNALQMPEKEALTANALNYIRQSQRPDGSWNDEKMIWRKKPSAELQTALMLAAINGSPLWADRQVTDKAVRRLLDHQQPNGGWEGGFFPIDNERYVKKEYVFATAIALQVLHKYRSELQGEK